MHLLHIYRVAKRLPMAIYSFNGKRLYLCEYDGFSMRVCFIF